MKNIIGLSEAAKILKIAPTTLLKRLHDGTTQIPYAHIGKVYKFKREDVEDYFNNLFKYPSEHTEHINIKKEE